MTPRKLRVVQIDDDKDNHLHNEDGLDAFIELEVIDSEIKAQKLLFKFRKSEEGIPPLDVILADVDFRKTNIPTGLDWTVLDNGHSALRPFGPLLLLPFLGSPAMSVFVPYSSYWNTPDVINNGYVCVALALVFAAIDGKHVTIEQARDRISNHTVQGQVVPLDASGQSMLNEARTALKNGLKLYRSRLLNSKAFKFIDVDRTMSRLDALEATEIDADAQSELVLLADDSGPLCLTLINGRSRLMEQIELSSLFGDLLDFGRTHFRDCLGLIGNELSAFERKSETVRGGQQATFQLACESLAECRTDRHLRDVIDGLANEKGQIVDWDFVRRLAVEFAWVGAWHARKQRDTEFVHKKLGLTVFVNGELRMHRHASNLYRRFIQVGNNETDDPNRRTLKVAGSKEPFCLNEDLPANLTDLECSLCLRFARSIEWHGPYPRWMTTPKE